jgi:AcrR family transcriptional regulator
VPKTRSDVSRDDKLEEILGAAERRLREHGYDGLSVAAISRELGLAQNAIYWYFPSKDHLFVAVLERMLRDVAARKPKGGDTTARILWWVDEFEPISAMRPAITERARRAPVVAEFAAALEELLSRMLSGALRDQVPDKELPQVVATLRATIEGTFAKGLPRKQRRALLSYALSRLA